MNLPLRLYLKFSGRTSVRKKQEPAIDNKRLISAWELLSFSHPPLQSRRPRPFQRGPVEKEAAQAIKERTGSNAGETPSRRYLRPPAFIALPGLRGGKGGRGREWPGDEMRQYKPEAGGSGGETATCTALSVSLCHGRTLPGPYRRRVRDQLPCRVSYMRIPLVFLLES